MRNSDKSENAPASMRKTANDLPTILADLYAFLKQEHGALTLGDKLIAKNALLATRERDCANQVTLATCMCIRHSTKSLSDYETTDSRRRSLLQQAGTFV